MLRNRTILIFILLLLSGCGPVFETQYTFSAPKTSSGKTCILQCENNKLHCEQLEEMNYQNCLTRAELEYSRCEARKLYRYESDGDVKCIRNCYCYRQSCTRNLSRCDQGYRSCYQGCGGTVTGKTVCVRNCEEIQDK